MQNLLQPGSPRTPAKMGFTWSDTQGCRLCLHFGLGGEEGDRRGCGGGDSGGCRGERTRLPHMPPRALCLHVWAELPERVNE